MWVLARVMTRDFDADSEQLLDQNFFPTHAPALEGEPLSLSRHLRVLEAKVRGMGGVDELIIDTASAAFALRNENDNSEVANFVMKPLVRLARKLNCVLVLVHHVGKAKAEEGTSREQAHRGRGASAWGDFSTSIFNLDADPHDKDRVTLTCGKRKNGGNYETVLRLDRDRRWFKVTDDTMVKPLTNDDLVVEAMESIGRPEIQTAEILSMLDGRVKQRTVRCCWPKRRRAPPRSPTITASRQWRQPGCSASRNGESMRWSGAACFRLIAPARRRSAFP